MEGAKHGRNPAKPASAVHFREQTSDDVDGNDDATVSLQNGSLEVHSEEDPGGDPYNHTGTFKRTVR